MAEVAVHLTLATLLVDYVMITIHIPEENELYQLRESQLPSGWKKFP